MLKVVDWDGIPLGPLDPQSRGKMLESLGIARDGLGGLAPPRG